MLVTCSHGRRAACRLRRSRPWQCGDDANDTHDAATRSAVAKPAAKARDLCPGGSADAARRQRSWQASAESRVYATLQHRRPPDSIPDGRSVRNPYTGLRRDDGPEWLRPRLQRFTTAAAVRPRHVDEPRFQHRRHPGWIEHGRCAACRRVRCRRLHSHRAELSGLRHFHTELSPLFDRRCAIQRHDRCAPHCRPPPHPPRLPAPSCSSLAIQRVAMLRWPPTAPCKPPVSR